MRRQGKISPTWYCHYGPLAGLREGWEICDNSYPTTLSNRTLPLLWFGPFCEAFLVCAGQCAQLALPHPILQWSLISLWSCIVRCETFQEPLVVKLACCLAVPIPWRLGHLVTGFFSILGIKVCMPMLAVKLRGMAGFLEVIPDTSSFTWFLGICCLAAGQCLSYSVGK